MQRGWSGYTGKERELTVTGRPILWRAASISEEEHRCWRDFLSILRFPLKAEFTIEKKLLGEPTGGYSSAFFSLKLITVPWTFGQGKKFSLSTLNLYSGSEKKKQITCLSVNASYDLWSMNGLGILTKQSKLVQFQVIPRYWRTWMNSYTKIIKALFEQNPRYWALPI